MKEGEQVDEEKSAVCSDLIEISVIIGCGIDGVPGTSTEASRVTAQ
jgi:hypothetical protein